MRSFAGEGNLTWSWWSLLIVVELVCGEMEEMKLGRVWKN
jgi:hypothetical protein